MKFVGVQLWIGRVDGENVDMHTAFVQMQDNRPVDAVWHIPLIPGRVDAMHHIYSCTLDAQLLGMKKAG